MSNPFDELEAILSALNPRHKESKRAAELEADAPERIRQVWQAIGLSDFTRDLSVRPRTRGQSEEELASILGRWSQTPKTRAAWGATAEAMRGALPDRLRIVRALTEEVGITDESAQLADPPVLLVRSESRPALRWCETYTEWLIWRLVSIVAQKRSTGYRKLVDLPATQVLREGYPVGMFRLAEGVWWMEMPRLSREAEDPVIRTMVFYASLESYSTFVFDLPEEQRAFMANPPSEVWWLRDAGPLDLTKGTPDGFRAMGTTGYDGKPEKGMRAVGRVGKWLVWIGGVAKGDWAVNFNPDGREEVSNWLDRLGLKVKQKIPLTLRVNGKNVGHDYYGW